MSATTDKILEQLKTLSLLEASELVKQIEEAFGVSAAASAGAVMMAAPAAAAEAVEAVEDDVEFGLLFDGLRGSAGGGGDDDTGGGGGGDAKGFLDLLDELGSLKQGEGFQLFEDLVGGGRHG